MKNEKKSAGFGAVKKRKLFFYLSIIVVPMIQFFIFYVIVNFNTFRLAFQKYEIVDGTLVSHFAWFDNISQVVQEFFTLPVLQAAFRNSLLAYLIGLVFGMSLSLFFSYYIFKKFPFANTFKVFLYLPNIVSVMALAIMYKYIFDYAMPLVLNRENPDLKIVRLLTDQNTRFAMIMLFNTFVTLGSNVLLYTGTMSGISPSILEAAQVDGVNEMQELFWIVLPQVYPTIVTFLIAQMATVFTNQINLLNFYGGVADWEIQTLGYYLYINIDRYKNDMTQFPRLATIGLVLTCIALPITLGMRKLLNAVGPSNE